MCSDNHKRPQDNQHFTLRYYRDISAPDMEMCMDSYGEGKRRDIMMGGCHHGQGNQYFRYDLDSQQIFHGPLRNQNCVEADVSTQAVYVTECNRTKMEQRWVFGFVNETNVRNWLTYGSGIEDKGEREDLAHYFKKAVHS